MPVYFTPSLIGDSIPTLESGKFLGNDGTNLLWLANGAGDLKADGTVALTAAWSTAYPLLFPVGSAAAPSMSFAGYATTGWYYNTAGRIYVSVGNSNIAYFYSGGMTVETGKNLYVDGGRVSSHLIANLDSDTDEIDSYTWAGGYGLLVASCTTDGVTAVWRLEGTTLVAISVNALFTATKDGAGTYNVYFDTGALKFQNKVGNDKVVYVGFFGV